MTAAMRASATKTAGGSVELVFPYSADLVDDLKTEIPGRFRRWDPDDKVWRVMGAYAPTAINLLLEHFPSASTPDDYARPGRCAAAVSFFGPVPIT
jgi:hypothetical protein